MRPSQASLSSFVAFLLTLMAFTGLLVVFDRSTPGGPLPTPTPPPAPMRRAPSPVIVAPSRRRSVVLVSVSGASAEALSGWMADGAMPALAQLSARGWTATLHSVSPPLTEPALMALATGTTSPQAEPVWRLAAQQHRTAALLFWPDADAIAANQGADYALTCGPPIAAAETHTATLSAGEPWPGMPVSFGPPYAGALSFPSPTGAATWQVLALDTRDDSLAGYDTFFLSSDPEPTVNRDTVRLALDEWGTLPVYGRAAPGLMVTVTGLRMVTDTASFSPTTGISPTVTLTPALAGAPLMELTLYQIAAQPVTARPVSLGQEVIGRFGFCPPLPHPRTVALGQLSPTAFGELVSLRARWAMHAAVYVFETYHPHLLVVHHEALPVSQQALLLIHPRQPGYSPARAAQFAEHRQAVAAAVDDGLDELLAVADLNDTTVLVVSEHGMSPAHTEVNVSAVSHTVWKALGQLDGGLLSRRTPPRVHAEGGCVSIEVDLGEGEAAIAVDAIIRALRTLSDPHTGEPVFARVARRSDAGSWAEAWPYAGDVVAQAAPGYVPVVASVGDSVFVQTSVYGQTGYSSRQPTMQGRVIAAGRGVFAGQEGDNLHLMNLVPTVAQWLGIHCPSNGQP